MKITRLETIHVKPRWLFLKIHTDQDIVGVGEPTLEGRCRTVETAIREMEEYLIGQDPRQIEKHWQTLHRSPFYRTGPVLCSALSGVEQALWDILGKSLNAPVWQLLGGKVRDRVRMYGWVAGEQTGDYIENFKRSIHDRQFTLYKFVPVPAMRYLESPAVIEQVVENVAQLRAAAGPHIDIGLDFHARTTPALAKVLARKLEQFDPLFLEEPVLPGDTQALRDISNSTCIPIATGERLFTRWQFQDIIQQQAVAIVQPDVSHAGGILEVRKIAAMAEPRNIALAPHCPLGPVALAACLQVAACTPNFLAQEHLHLGEGYLRDPFQVDEQGYIPVSDKPGLGVELDDAAIEEKRYPGDWQNPWFTLEDGSYAEW
ncbi:MAG: galactonate dehydratase [bacterium]|jgi:galactonate dehydratase